MTLVLDSTPGGASANSYLTLAEANTYFESRFHSDDWDNADDPTKNECLAWATRLIDQAYDWNQFTTTTTQSLKWPRSGILDYRGRIFIDFMAIPPELKNAVAEFAMQLVTTDRTLDSDVQTQGIKAITAGSVHLEFKDYVYRKLLPDAVYDAIPEWWGEPVDGRGTGSAWLRRA